jgi:hypothetical protein
MFPFLLPGCRYERRRAFLSQHGRFHPTQLLATAPKTRFQLNDAELGVSHGNFLIELAIATYNVPLWSLAEINAYRLAHRCGLERIDWLRPGRIRQSTTDKRGPPLEPQSSRAVQPS